MGSDNRDKLVFNHSLDTEISPGMNKRSSVSKKTQDDELKSHLNFPIILLVTESLSATEMFLPQLFAAEICKVL